MDKAIIQTDTRVIRRVTTDDNPSIAADESVVVLDSKIDLGGGFWKLDGQNNKVSANALEVETAGVDEAKEGLKRQRKILDYNDSIETVLADKTVPQSLINYFQKLKDIQ